MASSEAPAIAIAAGTAYLSRVPDASRRADLTCCANGCEHAPGCPGRHDDERRRVLPHRGRLYQPGRADTGRPGRALDPRAKARTSTAMSSCSTSCAGGSSATACRCGAPRSIWGPCIRRSAASAHAGCASFKVVEEYRILRGSEATDEYLRSPIRATIERGTPFRRRLIEDTPEYPLLSKLRKAGATDYFALALNRTFRRFPVVTWATDRPSGFSDADIAALEEINPALAAIVETARRSAGSPRTCSTPISGRRPAGACSPDRSSGRRANGCAP